MHRSKKAGHAACRQRLPGQKRGDNAGLYDILSRTKLPLIGVLPYDGALSEAQNKGLLAFETPRSAAFRQAVENTARRLDGENVRLFEGVRTGFSRTKLY